MRVLVTGFDPFDNEVINPSWEAVKLLPPTIGQLELDIRQLPTSFARAATCLQELLAATPYDFVVHVGQHGGVSSIQVERVAINLANARISDNDGYSPKEQPVVAEAPTAYFATLPTQAMVEAIRDEGIPAQASFSAGTFVCNSTMFHALHLAATEYPHLKAGFIHVPYLPQQVVDRPTVASMPLETIAQALEAAIRTFTA